MSNDNPATLSIVVPAYNEAGAIKSVVKSLREEFPDCDILVVDDGSSDGTSEAASEVDNIRVIRHSANRGYGASWRTGIASTDSEYIAFFDGDGQFDSADLQRLYDLITEKRLDMVSGWRQSMDKIPLERRPGKWFLARLANFLVNKKVPDLNCGLRIMRRSLIQRYAHLLPMGFSASTTSMLVLMKRGYAVDFLPIKIRERVGKSSVKLFRDGFGTILLMVRLTTLLDPLRVFLPVAMALLLLAVPYSLYSAYTFGQGIPVLGGVLAVTGLLVFFMGILADQISALRLERFEVNMNSGIASSTTDTTKSG